MNSFDFDDRQVRICGKVYTINFNGSEFNDKAAAVDAALKNITDDKVTDELTDAFRDLIDFMLGAGAFDEIFSEQAVSLYNLSRLILFLTGECAEQARMYKRLDFSDLEESLKTAENAETNTMSNILPVIQE